MTDKPHIRLDEIREGLAEWADMGAVEQMRDDATRWVYMVESLVEQYEGVTAERDEFERQRNYDYTRFSETKKALLESEAERVRLKEQLEAVTLDRDIAVQNFETGARVNQRLEEQVQSQQEWIDRVAEFSTDAATAADKAEREVESLKEQLEVLREFYDAWWAHENGIVDFDLHHSQVERLRAAANAAFRLTHPPDSGSAVAPAEGSRDQASGSPTPNPASEPKP